MFDSRDFFRVFSGAKIRPHFQWNLGAFFPNFEKKTIFKKKKKKILRKLGFSFSHHTHKLNGDNLLPLNLISPSIFLMAKVCVIAIINLFFIDQK